MDILLEQFNRRKARFLYSFTHLHLPSFTFIFRHPITIVDIQSHDFITQQNQKTMFDYISQIPHSIRKNMQNNYTNKQSSIVENDNCVY